LDNKEIASLERPKGLNPPVICGQHRVAEVILKHMAQYPNTKVLWDHNLVEIKDHGDSVTAVCDVRGENAEITGRYLVGADGARSTVRKLIGCTFEGFTYDKMVVATNVYYPFLENGFGLGQFIVHPEHFALVISHHCQSNRRLQNVLQTAYSVAHMRKTHLSALRKLRQTWTLSLIRCSRVQSQSSAISECFRPTSFINWQAMLLMRAILLGAWVSPLDFAMLEVGRLLDWHF